MKKLFRFHRGGLADSLATTVEVSSLDDVLAKAQEFDPNICGIEVSPNGDHDSRLPEEWGDGINTYYVTGSRWDGVNYCVGMTNFYEA